MDCSLRLKQRIFLVVSAVALLVVPSILYGQNFEESESHLGFKLGLSQGLLRTDEFFGVSGWQVGVSLNYPEDKVRYDLHLGVDYAPVQKAGIDGGALDNGIMLISIRTDKNYFTTPFYTFLGQYFIVGIGYDYLIWRYAEPVLKVPAERISIEMDEMQGLELYCGIGVNFIQTSHLTFGLEAMPGGIFWMANTREGYPKEIFPDFLYFKMNFNVAVRF